MIGTRTEGKVLAVLLQMGKQVLLPFGGGIRYDLAYDEGGRLVRVQCKTARLTKGCLIFNTCSLGRKNEMHHYDNDADFFGVYSPDLDSVYLIAVKDTSRGKQSLRIDKPKSNMPTIKWAADYKVS
jgi:PD-(D/E)XK endonuclease